MKKATVFFRKGNVIRTPEGDKTFKSINKAKRASRELQLEQGSLGAGLLRVVEKLPHRERNTNTA